MTRGILLPTIPCIKGKHPASRTATISTKKSTWLMWTHLPACWGLWPPLLNIPHRSWPPRTRASFTGGLDEINNEKRGRVTIQINTVVIFNWPLRRSEKITGERDQVEDLIPVKADNCELIHEAESGTTFALVQFGLGSTLKENLQTDH